MWWALIWAFVFGGFANNGWAAAFGFILSGAWQMRGDMEKRIISLQRKINEQEDRLRTSRDTYALAPKWQPGDPII